MFKDEDISYFEDKLEDFTLEELPSIDVINKDIEENVNISSEEDEPVSVPLVSIDASKYNSNEAMGFKVTEGNRTYDLTDYEFDVVVAVVAGEFDLNYDDALGVVSVILNRCDSDKWRNWAGATPYHVLSACALQFSFILKTVQF